MTQHVQRSTSRPEATSSEWVLTELATAAELRADATHAPSLQNAGCSERHNTQQP